MLPHLLPGVALVLATIVLAAPVLTSPTSDARDIPLDAPCTRADQFDEMPGAGPSCFAHGLWNIRLADGRVVRTHGPDHLPSDDEVAQMLRGHDDGDEKEGDAGGPVGTSGDWRAPARAATCVSDEATERHGLIVYTRPADKPDSYDTWVDRIRHMFYLSNGLLREAGEADGLAYSYKMACDADGRPRVDDVVLPTSRWTDSFESIVSDLVALGYARANVKYWIWHYDGISCGGCSGWGTIPGGDDPSASNPNNAGTAWGVTFVRDSMLTLMHENGHNLGAVQMSAPRSTGGWHCNDGYDVMCYADDGYKESYSSSACPTKLHYDCGQDDYFDPTPAPGSYLDTHWNLAASYDHHLARVTTASLPSAPRDLLATPVPGGTVVLSWDPPTDAGAAPVTKYSIYRGPCLARAGLGIAGSLGQIETFLTRTTSTTFTDTLPESGHWSYYVAAVNSYGEGTLSQQAVAIHPGTLQPVQVTRCYAGPGP